MVWPFSRRASGSDAADADPPAGRRGEAKDPEAQLRAQTRRRLIGAAALLLVAVIVVPMLLDSAPRPLPDNVSITVATPTPAERRPPVEAKVAEPAPAEPEPAPPPADAAGRSTAEPAPKPAGPPQAAAPASSAASAPTPEAKPAAAAPAAAGSAQPAAKAGSGAEPAAAAAPQPEAGGRFLVQVAAFANPAAAEELHIVLLKDGYKAYVAQVQTVNGTVHRVRVGPFSSRDEAQRTIERLKTAGHKATLVGG